MGALICTAMIAAIDLRTLMFAGIWMVVGLGVYFMYSKKHSKLRNPAEILPHASDFESNK
jgi:APA family basic amino acid/polyamine antiporter